MTGKPWWKLGKTLAVIFVVAVLCNYPWEPAQAPLYVGMNSARTAWWHCFVASLGDGLLVLVIFAVGWAVLRRHTWFVAPGARGTLVIVGVGLVLGITIEWIAVHVMQRWAYTAHMPRVPGLDVGLVPVAQMLVLPSLTLRVVVWWRGHPGAPKDGYGTSFHPQP